MQAASVLELPGSTLSSTQTAIGDEIEIALRSRQARIERRAQFSGRMALALGRVPHRDRSRAGKVAEAAGRRGSVGLFPWWGILLSWALELLLLVAVIVVPAKLASMRPYEPPPKPKYDIIYYSGNELPRTEDAGGAESGRSGRAGGREAHHPTQTIRVARGSSLRETVADAPKLDLPKSNSAVANLLALKALPGPAPAEGMQSSVRAPVMSADGSAPAPQVADPLRAAPQLNVGAVPPSATVPQREISTLRLPGSNAVQVVPPPVSAPEQITNQNPRLTMPAPNVVAPPPVMTREVAAVGPGFGPADLEKQIVPPPVQVGDASAQPRNISGLGGTPSYLRPSNSVRVQPSVLSSPEVWVLVHPPFPLHHRSQGEARSPAKAEAIAAQDFGGALDADWPRPLQPATAAETHLGSWFPASPDRNSGFREAAAAVPWRCLHPEATSPAWVVRAGEREQYLN